MGRQKIIIYQIFTRLFGNRSNGCKPGGTIAENGSGKMSFFTDELLHGLRAKGYSHVWYTGLIRHATTTDYTRYGILSQHPAIVKGKAGSPYAIVDYYDIDPDLADDVNNRMQEFEQLLDRSHRAGLKVIIDFVPNHVARQYHSTAKVSTTLVRTMTRRWVFLLPIISTIVLALRSSHISTPMQVRQNLILNSLPRLLATTISMPRLV